jgi:hypothetical protein
MLALPASFTLAQSVHREGSNILRSGNVPPPAISPSKKNKPPKRRLEQLEKQFSVNNGTTSQNDDVFIWNNPLHQLLNLDRSTAILASVEDYGSPTEYWYNIHTPLGRLCLSVKSDGEFSGDEPLHLLTLVQVVDVQLSIRKTQLTRGVEMCISASGSPGPELDPCCIKDQEALDIHSICHEESNITY